MKAYGRLIKGSRLMSDLAGYGRVDQYPLKLFTSQRYATLIFPYDT